MSTDSTYTRRRVSRQKTVRLAELLDDELNRARGAMRYPGHPPPYYLSYLVRDEDIWVIDARFGALFEDSHTQRRDCLADVRVGSYKSDQVQDGGLHDNSREDESYGYVELPLSGSDDGVRHALWRLTEARYREAVDAYLRKRSVERTYRDAHPELRSFESNTNGRLRRKMAGIAPERDRLDRRRDRRRAAAQGTPTAAR